MVNQVWMCITACMSICVESKKSKYCTAWYYELFLVCRLSRTRYWFWHFCCTECYLATFSVLQKAEPNRWHRSWKMVWFSHSVVAWQGRYPDNRSSWPSPSKVVTKNRQNITCGLEWDLRKASKVDLTTQTVRNRLRDSCDRSNTDCVTPTG